MLEPPELLPIDTRSGHDDPNNATTVVLSSPRLRRSGNRPGHAKGE
jgi:hypothetical protein